MTNKTHPENRDSNAGRQSNRVVDLHSIEFWRAGHWVPLARVASKGLPEGIDRLRICEGDLVDRRTGPGSRSTNLSIKRLIVGCFLALRKF